MNRWQRERLLGKATNSAPSMNDQTVTVGRKAPPQIPTAAETRQDVKQMEATLDLHFALTQLGDFALQRKQAEANIGRQVRKAMDLGATWQMIGDRLETTTQAAWSRYHQIRNPQDSRAASDVLLSGGGIADRSALCDVELPLE